MKTFVASLLLVVSASVVTGQAVAQGPADEPTLPEIEVRPPQEAPSEPPSSELFLQDQRPAFALPLSYPSLSQQAFGDGFGGDTGIFRSSTSIFDTPAAASIRSLEEIRQRQAPDMFQALQNEVGVLIQSTAAGQASPFIRGLTGQQILILVDGIRLNNSIFRRGPNQYFNTIDPGMVDHIEILRGQGSVLWGSDAIGGVINIVTRSPDREYADCCGDFFGEEFT
ncbi:MAG: TonB-dependent receptor plug domain-containing protein, partial [Planctomycetales bacterium]|nr:TonB-dependent receptor plug domain-containing protein [Planctomycetales bacterium]